MKYLIIFFTTFLIIGCEQEALETSEPLEIEYRDVQMEKFETNLYSEQQIEQFVQASLSIILPILNDDEFAIKYEEFENLRSFSINDLASIFDIDIDEVKSLGKYANMADLFYVDTDFQNRVLESFGNQLDLENKELDKDTKELILRLGPCGFWAHAWGVGSSALAMAAGASTGPGGLAMGVIYTVNTITELANCP